MSRKICPHCEVPVKPTDTGACPFCSRDLGTVASLDAAAVAEIASQSAARAAAASAPTVAACHLNLSLLQRGILLLGGVVMLLTLAYALWIMKWYCVDLGPRSLPNRYRVMVTAGAWPGFILGAISLRALWHVYRRQAPAWMVTALATAALFAMLAVVILVADAPVRLLPPAIDIPLRLASLMALTVVFANWTYRASLPSREATARAVLAVAFVLGILATMVSWRHENWTGGSSFDHLRKTVEISIGLVSRGWPLPYFFPRENPQWRLAAFALDAVIFAVAAGVVMSGGTAIWTRVRSHQLAARGVHTLSKKEEG